MEMNVCRWCKKTFVAYPRTKVCKECRPRDEEQFQMLEEYLKQHPGKNAIQLSKELNIDMAILLSYIEEGRLVPTVV